MPRRCHWARGEPDIVYHDAEWGVPSHDDRGLFELLVLEGAQAGLSWSTILARRAGYRRAFAGFDVARVARFKPTAVARLLRDPGIIRHRGKIESAIDNARGVLAIQREHGSFAAYLWSFVGGQPLDNRRRSPRQVPAQTALSQALSRDLKQRGFTFVGPTICYAFMQAVGLVNDHLTSCFRYAPVRQLARRAGRGEGLSRPAGEERVAVRGKRRRREPRAELRASTETTFEPRHGRAAAGTSVARRAHKGGA